MDTKFINKTNAAGLHITEASPVDDRGIIATESMVSVLSNVEPMPNRMYAGMEVKFLDTGKRYIWVEAEDGLMIQGYTYPAWANDIQGHNYANKTYNFVLYESSNTFEVVYDASTPGSILLPMSKIPYKFINDLDSANVVLKSQLTDFKELEFPNTVEAATGGISIVFDPAPSPPELFKVTIF